MKLNNNKKSVKISRSLFMLYAVMVCGIVFALPAFAADDPLVVVENLSTFIFSLIRAVGLILLGWGIVQVGLSLQSHDPSQRSQGFLTLAGGLVITFAKEMLAIFLIPRRLSDLLHRHGAKPAGFVQHSYHPALRLIKVGYTPPYFSAKKPWRDPALSKVHPRHRLQVFAPLRQTALLLPKCCRARCPQARIPKAHWML